MATRTIALAARGARAGSKITSTRARPTAVHTRKAVRQPERRLASSAAATSTKRTPVRMTASEAFVETLVANKVDNVFGIVGSAFMDALDLFDVAKIRFISVQHEQNAAHMADGFARVTGRHGVCIAQNGPGISNFVTGIAAAFWAHSPVVAITPEAATTTKGHGGFQETDQLPLFEPITKYQAHVNNPARMAEFTGRAFDHAMIQRGPTQLNIPRDFFYSEHDYIIPQPVTVERSAGGPQSLKKAVAALQNAKNPVILSGGGIVMANGVDAVKGLAEYLNAPVCTTYLHNDAFPQSHPLHVGPLGYMGSQAAMHAIKDADVVLALGTRLGPFGTNPQYGIDYWPKDALLIQVDADFSKLGLVKPADITLHGDAKLAAEALLQSLHSGAQPACAATKDARMSKMNQYKQAWKETLHGMTNGAPHPPAGKMKPRQVLEELRKAMPKDAMVATDIGNVCSTSNSYLFFDEAPSFLAAMTYGNCGYAFPAAMGAKVGRPDRFAVSYAGEGAWGMSLNEVLTCVRENIPTTAVVFNNGQWGAEKKNQVLWFGDRYIGTNLESPSFAGVAQAMGAEGIKVDRIEDVGDALRQCEKNQRNGKTTVLELMLSRELGDPFRRDAMKLPQRLLPKYKVTDRSEESATGQPVDISN